MNAVVLYDGSHTMNNAVPFMSQTIKGYYDPAPGVAGKITLIGGSAQSNKQEWLVAPGVNELNPFQAVEGASWDNVTRATTSPTGPIRSTRRCTRRDSARSTASRSPRSSTGPASTTRTATACSTAGNRQPHPFSIRTAMRSRTSPASRTPIGRICSSRWGTSRPPAPRPTTACRSPSTHTGLRTRP